MSRFLILYEKIPRRLRRFLRNPVTLWLHRYLVLRQRLLSSSITGITIELTDKCNLRCRYCPKSLGIGVVGKHMDFDLFQKAVDEAFALQPIRQVCLAGFGEPFLYPHFEEALIYVRKANPAVRITTTTNGTLLSEEFGQRMAVAGLNQLTVSVNATSREQYLEINGADLYESVVEKTRAFLRGVNGTNCDMRVLVQVLEGPNGPAEIAKFRQDWEPHLGRCGEIQVQPFVNWAGQIDSGKIAMKHQPTTSGGWGYPCAHLGSWLISREGNGLPCCMVLPEDPGELHLGNLRDISLREIFMGTRMAELRRKNFNGELYDLRPCDRCDAYKTVPNVWFRNPIHSLIGNKWL
jgi:MoaA/NifB/PqqE/SkfB family radical SAM enzyme